MPNANAMELSWLMWSQVWQVTLLAIVVALLVRWLAKDRPHLAHVLWLLVLLKCITPPVWSSPGGLFCWLQSDLGQADPAIAHPTADATRLPDLDDEFADADWRRDLTRTAVMRALERSLPRPAGLDRP